MAKAKKTAVPKSSPGGRNKRNPEPLKKAKKRSAGKSRETDETQPSRKIQPAPKGLSARKSRPDPKAKAAEKKPPAKKDRSAPKDQSAEEKIKEAARKLFTRKGFAATRTRDIAQEAGINLALLNYYFRSKEKLFEIIMAENFRQFIHGISVNLFDEHTTINEKIDRIVTAYIDFLTGHPDLPLFVLNEIRGNPTKLARQIDLEAGPMRSYFLKQVRDAGKDGKLLPIDPFHFIANLIGLTVFPFVARPILQRVTNTTDEQFDTFMQERKTLVPIWIRAMLGADRTDQSHPPV